MTKEAMMTQHERGPGEVADKARSRRIRGPLALLLAIGGAMGAGLALMEPKGSAVLSDVTIPPLLAIAAAAVTLIAMIVGSTRYYRVVDEFEQRDNLMAGAVGANILIVGYPIWWLLWKGGLVGEPQHVTIYIVVSLTIAATYLYRKLG